MTKPIQMEKLLKAVSRYLTVVPVLQKPAVSEGTPVVPASREVQAQKFYQELPAELVQIEEAIGRQDRVRVKEVAS